MPWRTLHLDGESFRWTVSVSAARAAHGELRSIQLRVLIRAEGTRIEAVFHGWMVDDLWDGPRQNITVTPRVVADVVRIARERGCVLDHAEALLPAAVTSADPADTALAAAAAQWFVPYPGRAAIAAALARSGGSFEVAAAQLSTSYRFTAAQVAGWAERLGLKSPASPRIAIPSGPHEPPQPARARDRVARTALEPARTPAPG
jgi:hypothetical protein